MKLSNTLDLIETRTINDVLVNGYYGAKEAWFSRNEIGYTNQGSVGRPLSRNNGMTMQVDTLIRWLEVLNAQIIIEPLDGDDGYILDGEIEL